MLYVSMTPNIWGMIIVQFHDYTTGRRYNEIFAVRPNVALWMIAYEHPVAAVYGVENGCTQWDALLIPCRDTYEAPPRLFDVPAYDGVPSMGDN